MNHYPLLTSVIFGPVKEELVFLGMPDAWSHSFVTAFLTDSSLQEHHKTVSSFGWSIRKTF